jgi:hypothetical protein
MTIYEIAKKYCQTVGTDFDSLTLKEKAETIEALDILVKNNIINVNHETKDVT